MGLTSIGVNTPGKSHFELLQSFNRWAPQKETLRGLGN